MGNKQTPEPLSHDDGEKRVDNWLYERSQFLSHIVSNLPKGADHVQFRFGPPKFGWIDLHFIVNGEEKNIINLSDVYEPFTDIRKWLENIVEHLYDFTPFGVNIDCESYNVLLYYEPFPIVSDAMLSKNPPTELGLFYTYDSYEKKVLAGALCETKEFVTTIYNNIIQYAREMKNNDMFVDEWVEEAYKEEWGDLDGYDPRVKEIFINVVSSPILDKFIKEKDCIRRFNIIKG